MPVFDFGTLERLTDRQAKFVSEYIKNGDNATQAYKDAGYKYKNENVAAVQGACLLKTPKIARAIQRKREARNNRMQLEEDYELKKAMDILDKCMTNKKVTDFRGNPVKDEEGNPVYAFDAKGANAALVTICRLRGKFRDKLEMTQDVSDRANRIAEILSKVNTKDKEDKEGKIPN